MPDHSLLMLLDLVRRRTLRVLEGVSEEESLDTPAGLQNSILWHAGHAFVIVEWLTMEALAREPMIPDGWFDLFNWKSRPGRVPREEWPPLDHVFVELKQQHGRLRSILGRLTQEQLAAPAPNRPHRNVRYLILRGLHDESCHAGEIWLLRKMQRSEQAV